MGTMESVEDRTYRFAKRIIKLYEYLKRHGRHYGIGDQVFRSGTSIGANIAEGKYAQSRPDFITKYTIALKEAGETEYWLRLLRDSNYINEKEAESMLTDCQEIIKILASIIIKTKENMSKGK